MRGESLFEAAGGSEGVLRIAHAWHQRVMADEVVAWHGGESPSCWEVVNAEVAKRLTAHRAKR